jgi:hypothetical protein
MHSFSICPATTLESVRRIHLLMLMACNLRSPNKVALYSAILLVHLSIPLLNTNLAAYRSLIPEGEVNMVAAPAPAAPKLRRSGLTMVLLVLLPQLQSWVSSTLPRNRPGPETLWRCIFRSPLHTMIAQLPT